MASNPIPSPPVTKQSRALAVAPCNSSSSPPSTSSSPCDAAYLPVASAGTGGRGLLALGAGFLASTALLCPAGGAGATRIEYYATVGEKMCDLTVVKSGLGYCDVAVGTGAQPPRGELINVHYTARFTDGTVFDSSYNRGRPLTMRIGAGKILRGLEQGISGGGGVPPMLLVMVEKASSLYLQLWHMDLNQQVASQKHNMKHKIAEEMSRRFVRLPLPRRARASPSTASPPPLGLRLQGSGLTRMVLEAGRTCGLGCLWIPQAELDWGHMATTMGSFATLGRPIATRWHNLLRKDDRENFDRMMEVAIIWIRGFSPDACH